MHTLCPKFLHTNSTSHTWPFSAIAELIDNAYDPDVSAKQIWIDKTVINDNICLTFTDNGNGMNSEKLHKMLSPRQLSDPAECRNSLRAILTHSLFSTEEKLLAELDAIIGKKGTRIIIWNLRK
ncbi:hypothetical protein EK904_014789 [Melospiza melodia maxima]|nr:hypothetical protein EK904_014789 [Melospiza melodia maxima]